MLGLEKNAFAQMASFSLLRGVLITLVLGNNCFLPIFAPIFLWLIPIIIISPLITALFLSRSTRLSYLSILGSFVIGDLLLSFIIFRSTILGFLRGGIIWRGTVYPTKKLLKGRRVKF